MEQSKCNRDLSFFHEVMRSMLCRSCLQSLRAFRCALQGPVPRIAHFQSAVKACVQLYFHAEPETFLNSSSTVFSAEIMRICVDGASRSEPSAVGLSSPRKQISLGKLPHYDLIEFVHESCQFLSSECSMCVKVGDGMTKLACGHRLCVDCYKIADKSVAAGSVATPGPSLNVTQQFLCITCPVTERCGASAKVAIEGAQKRLPVHFASLLRLKALKRETELITSIKLDHSVTLSRAFDIRRRIHSIVEGGKDDLFNPRSSYAPRLSGLLQHALEALFSICSEYHSTSQSSDLFFIDDVTIRVVLAYINSPAISSQHSGQNSASSSQRSTTFSCNSAMYARVCMTNT